MPIRVLIADDHAVVRQALRTCLEGDRGMEVVGEAKDGAEALRIAHRLRHDVILMDRLMPGVDGLTATAAVRRELPDTEVLALTIVLEDSAVVGAVRAGAIGYMLKNAEPEELRTAIRAAVPCHMRIFSGAPELRASLAGALVAAGAMVGASAAGLLVGTTAIGLADGPEGVQAARSKAMVPPLRPSPTRISTLLRVKPTEGCMGYVAPSSAVWNQNLPSVPRIPRRLTNPRLFRTGCEARRPEDTRSDARGESSDSRHAEAQTSSNRRATVRLRTSIRVLVVDDQRIIRQGIRNLLTGRTGVQIVGEADCGESAVRMSKRLRPGVVLMDLVMPGIGGVETIRRIIRLGLDTRVFVLTSFASDLDVRPALDAGAIGILSKDAEPEALLRAIKDVWRPQGRPEDEDSQRDKRAHQEILATGS